MEPVELRYEGRAAIVSINRPDRANSLSRATVAALGRAGERIERDGRARVAVLTGAGERVFCAGADLEERRTMSREAVLEQLRAYRSELAWLHSGQLPTVAAINGAALGGGLELALRCDLRIAAAHASLGLPETSLAIIPAAGGTQYLPRIVGEARAKEMILLGRRLNSDEALQWGLIHRVASAQQPLLEQTLSWVTPILEGAPVAQRAALHAIAVAAALPLEQGMQRELSLYEECLDTDDRMEALQAFAEKRPPRFSGR